MTRKTQPTVQYQFIALRQDSDVSRIGVRKLGDEVQVEVYEGQAFRFPLCTGRLDPADVIKLARALLHSVGMDADLARAIECVEGSRSGDEVDEHFDALAERLRKLT